MFRGTPAAIPRRSPGARLFVPERRSGRRELYRVFTPRADACDKDQGFSTHLEGGTSMFARELHQAGHTKRFVIKGADKGWEVREEQDSEILKRVCYTDWHRVERAMQSIAQQIDELEGEGWSARNC
jgi:hypothetical protein